MTKIPEQLREEMARDPYYQKCCRSKEGTCQGRITWEHAWIYAGRQIQERFSIIPLCWHHHLGDGLNKEINHWISINRASSEDFAKYPKKNWAELKLLLNQKYGIIHI